MALFNKNQDKNAKVESPKTASPMQSLATNPVSAAPASEKSPVVAARPTAAYAGAYLDSGSKISGKLNFDGPTRIDGQVDGEISAKDSLTIGESAIVTAQIKAASIVVAGKVSGDLIAANRIEIRLSAKVVGNLTAPTLVIHEGAVFEGHCSMSPEGTREDRKVTMFPKEERLAQVISKQA
jgi:cytoskeletal protein CcmA (bactofilin family)